MRLNQFMRDQCLGGVLALAMASAQAESWLARTWAAQTGGPAKTVALLKQPVMASDEELPAHWRAYQVQEPVFGAKILVAETGPPDAPPLLLIHGLGQKGLRDWLPIVPALASRYRLILLDLPGFGASANGHLGKLTPTRYARLLHGIKPLFSEQPVALIGHSMGGAVALRYAASFPADVSQLLLLDVAGILQRTAFVKHSAMDRLGPSEQLPNALLSYALSLQTLSATLLEKAANLPDPSIWLARSDQAWNLAFAKAPNLNAALGLVGEDFSAAIHELQQPVALLWGGQDTVAPLRTAKVLLAGLPQASLTVIDDAGHVPMSSHPERVSDWLLHTLDQAHKPPTPTPVAPTEPASTPPSQTLHCQSQLGGQLSGDFDRLLIRNCRGLKLERLRARQIELVDSALSMQDVQLAGEGARLSLNHSSLVATASSLAGPIQVTASRLDFAGVTLQGDQPFAVGERSRLLLSVSRSRRADASTRYLHGDHLLSHTVF